MAVSFGAASTLVISAATPTTITPTMPATIAAGNALVLLVGIRNETANVVTPAGWTSAGVYAGGGGTFGASTGPSKIYAFTRVATATSADTLGAITLNVTPNMAWCQVFRYANATGLWSFGVAGGSDSVVGTAWSVACDIDPGLTAGDHTLVGTCNGQAATTWSAQAISATGVSAWGGETEINEVNSTLGNDINGYVSRNSVTTGTSSAAPTITATAAGTTTNTRGVSIVVRLREIAVPLPVRRVQAVSSNAAPASTTTASSGTLPAGATAGNLLIAALGVDKDAGGISTPTGWTKFAEQNGTSVSHALFWKRAVGGETSVSFSWTTAVTGGSATVLAEYVSNTAGGPTLGAVTTPAYSDTDVTTFQLDPPAATAADARALAWIVRDTITTGWSPTASGWVTAGLAGNLVSSPVGGALLEYDTSLTAGQDLAAVTFNTGTATVDQHAGTVFILEPGPAVTTSTATGAITLAGSVTAAQASATTTGSVTLGGTSTGQAPATATTGSLTLSGAPAARGATTAAGSVTLAGTASATTPPSTAAGTLTLAGTVAAQAPATVLGSLALAGTVTARAAAAASGTVTLGGSATAAAAATASGSITLAGAAAPEAPASATGTITLSAGAPVAQATTAATGTITLGGTASTRSVSDWTAAVTATTPAAPTASGSLTLGGAPTARAAAAATGTVTLGGTVTVRAASSAAGVIVLGGTSTARAAATATGFITLGGSATGSAPSLYNPHIPGTATLTYTPGTATVTAAAGTATLAAQTLATATVAAQTFATATLAAVTAGTATLNGDGTSTAVLTPVAALAELQLT